MRWEDKRALSNIYNQIFNYAKTYITNNSIYSPQVLKATPESSKIFPIVVIKELDDVLFDEELKKTGQRNTVVFDINIYAQDKTTNQAGNTLNSTLDTRETVTVNSNRQVIINELKNLVDKVFGDYYGMTRELNEPIDNIDKYIGRQYMRYACIYDTEQKRIYRRKR